MIVKIVIIVIIISIHGESERFQFSQKNSQDFFTSRREVLSATRSYKGVVETPLMGSRANVPGNMSYTVLPQSLNRL